MAGVAGDFEESDPKFLRFAKLGLRPGEGVEEQDRHTGVLALQILSSHCARNWLLAVGVDLDSRGGCLAVVRAALLERRTSV